jgi:guanyl-specific ribonuclease Sa
MRRRRGSLWIGLLLAVILTIGSLSGCRSGGTAQQPQESAAVLQTITEEESPGNQEAQQDTQEEAGQEDGPGSGQETPDEAAPGQAAPEDDLPSIDEDGSYTTKEDVALYIHTYGKLPSNFITKKEAEKLGWDGGSLEPYAPGKCIGGNYFGNYEGLLPDGNYKECDIDTLGKKKRGARRIIYSDDGRIYYTDDHYESFTQLY